MLYAQLPKLLYCRGSARRSTFVLANQVSLLCRRMRLLALALALLASVVSR
jgi:hypothetical protein